MGVEEQLADLKAILETSPELGLGLALHSGGKIPHIWLLLGRLTGVEPSQYQAILERLAGFAEAPTQLLSALVQEAYTAADQEWRDTNAARLKPEAAAILEPEASRATQSAREVIEQGLLPIGEARMLSIGVSAVLEDEMAFAQQNPKLRIVATTIDPNGLEMARTKVEAAVAAGTIQPGQIEVILEDASRRFSGHDHTFAFIYSRLALHYLDEDGLRNAFAEMHRVAELGARIFVVGRSVDDRAARSEGAQSDPRTRMTEFLDTDYTPPRRVRRQFLSAQSLTDYAQVVGFTGEKTWDSQERLFKNFARTIPAGEPASLVTLMAVKAQTPVAAAAPPEAEPTASTPPVSMPPVAHVGAHTTAMIPVGYVGIDSQEAQALTGMLAVTAVVKSPVIAIGAPEAHYAFQGGGRALEAALNGLAAEGGAVATGGGRLPVTGGPKGRTGEGVPGLWIDIQVEPIEDSVTPFLQGYREFAGAT
jgi:SAM-dependent methyltransferase